MLTPPAAIQCGGAMCVVAAPSVVVARGMFEVVLCGLGEAGRRCQQDSDNHCGTQHEGLPLTPADVAGAARLWNSGFLTLLVRVRDGRTPEIGTKSWGAGAFNHDGFLHGRRFSMRRRGAAAAGLARRVGCHQEPSAEHLALRGAAGEPTLKCANRMIEAADVHRSTHKYL